MAYAQEDVYVRVAKVTGQDVTQTRNQIRHLVNKGIIPITDKRGSGRGTRRSYDLLSVCVGAALLRLQSIGRSGEALAGDAKLMTRVMSKYLKEGDSAPAYFVGLRDGAKHFVRSYTAPEPTVDLLKDLPGEAAWIVDIGGIIRLAKEVE